MRFPTPTASFGSRLRRLRPVRASSVEVIIKADIVISAIDSHRIARNVTTIELGRNVEGDLPSKSSAAGTSFEGLVTDFRAINATYPTTQHSNIFLLNLDNQTDPSLDLSTNNTALVIVYSSGGTFNGTYLSRLTNSVALTTTWTLGDSLSYIVDALYTIPGNPPSAAYSSKSPLTQWAIQAKEAISKVPAYDTGSYEPRVNLRVVVQDINGGSDDSSGSNSATIIAASVGSVVGLLALIICGFCYRSYRGQTRARQAVPSPAQRQVHRQVRRDEAIASFGTAMNMPEVPPISKAQLDGMKCYDVSKENRGKLLKIWRQSVMHIVNTNPIDTGPVGGGGSIYSRLALHRMNATMDETKGGSGLRGGGLGGGDADFDGPPNSSIASMPGVVPKHQFDFIDATTSTPTQVGRGNGNGSGRLFPSALKKSMLGGGTTAPTSSFRSMFDMGSRGNRSRQGSNAAAGAHHVSIAVDSTESRGRSGSAGTGGAMGVAANNHSRHHHHGQGDESTSVLIPTNPQVSFLARLASPLRSAAATNDTAMSVDFPLCTICLDDFALGDRIRQLYCRHVFHRESYPHESSSLNNANNYTYNNNDRDSYNDRDDDDSCFG
ncbi:hypothetical protein H4R33_000731 [Dimargaris cristalligena]|nr:hypothetical protein H4R33_000731 [Dimargaris cristalligena]